MNSGREGDLEAMTKTMTTLIEDGSNMCWASGPAGTSGGVMTPRKSIGNLVRCSALLAQGSLRKHCEKTACRDLCKGHQLRKKEKSQTSGKPLGPDVGGSTTVAFVGGRASPAGMSLFPNSRARLAQRCKPPHCDDTTLSLVASSVPRCSPTHRDADVDTDT